MQLAEWNAFERVTSLLQPSICDAERISRSQEIDSMKPRFLVINLPVEGTSHSYNVRFHSQKHHSLQTVPQSVEVFQRLVLRGLLTENIEELLI